MTRLTERLRHLGPSTRVITSALPAGANPCTKRIGRVGYGCASALTALNARTTASAIRAGRRKVVHTISGVEVDGRRATESSDCRGAVTSAGRARPFRPSPSAVDLRFLS
jgi:hypothetical protein